MLFFVFTKYEFWQHYRVTHLCFEKAFKCIMTKFRFGVPGINTNHYLYRHVNQESSLCHFCKDIEETEVYFVLCCPLYEEAQKQYNFSIILVNPRQQQAEHLAKFEKWLNSGRSMSLLLCSFKNPRKLLFVIRMQDGIPCWIL